MKKKKHEQNWSVGDIFLLPLKDGQAAVGQVVDKEPSVLNSVSCAFFGARYPSSCETIIAKPKLNDLFAVLFTTRDRLDAGIWKVVANASVEVPPDLFPFEALRSAGFVGAKVIGSRNVEEFVNAFHGLVPWDDWADPQYLDRLLLSLDKKPKTVFYKASKSHSPSITKE